MSCFRDSHRGQKYETEKQDEEGSKTVLMTSVLWVLHSFSQQIVSLFFSPEVTVYKN